MLQWDELDKLRAHRHKTGLVALVKNRNWNLDARKCSLAKITEWELEAGCSKEAKEQDDEQDGEESDEEEGGLLECESEELGSEDEVLEREEEKLV